MQRNAPDFANGSIARLLWSFALPSAISGLIGAVYNIVDQIFIGRCVGLLGNAATNVVFPVVTLTNAVAIMAGVGGASGFNLSMGRRDEKEAGRMIGSGLMLMAIAGCVIALAMQLFMEPLLRFFGATEETFYYACEYERIVACAIPLFILGTGGSAMIRADGSPKYALVSVVAGAVLNVGLDALFMLGFGMGIAGAAWATLIGQVISGCLVIGYFVFRFRTIRLQREHFRLSPAKMRRVFSLGMGPFINHFSMTLIQIMLNNALVTWGAVSQYGSEIPLACAGIAAKVNAIVSSIVVGIAQGAQPIISFNYGAKNYRRARETGAWAIAAVLSFSFVVFAAFQAFPRQITMLFGKYDNPAYYDFAEKYFRIFMMLVCVSGMQITVGNFFTSLGKPWMSVLISASRQIVALPILLLTLPRAWGLDGVLYAGPIADGICAALAIALFVKMWYNMGKQAVD